MTSITLHSPLHITVPRLEGCWLQTDSTGLTLNMNFPEITLEEMRCFRSGVADTGLYLSDTHPSIPFILLAFEDRAFGPIEGSFDASSQYPEFLDHFMQAPSPARLTMYLTDRGRIKGISHVCLSREITDRFKEAIQKQRSCPYAGPEFARAKAQVQQRYSTREMYAMCRAAPDRISFPG